MEIFTSLFFVVVGALDIVRYALWIGFPLATLILLFAKFGKSQPDYALSNFLWWMSIGFLAIVGGLLLIGVAATSSDRNFAYLVFQMLFVAGPALIACLVSAFLRPRMHA
ncbi:hypothetical protein [Shinella sp.]|uniref:hypothetical protein n=1 Tax=Shinella sp. TaxID=1870904 RepID=UPI0040359106